MAIAEKSNTRTEIVKRQVRLRGIQEIMFDRYAGDNQTKLSWHQKIYLVPGTSILCLPAENIASALSSHNTNSFAKRLRDARQFKKIANACRSFTSVTGPSEHPMFLPFLGADDKPITVGKFDETHDPDSGVYLHRSVARLKDGIPNPKERPVLPLPWALEFQFCIFPNREIKEQEIKNLFEEGGIAIGLGTFRGVYGKFVVEIWE